MLHFGKEKKCEMPEVIGLKHRYLLGDVLTLEFVILAYRTSVKTEIERISIKYPLLEVKHSRVIIG